MANTQHLDIFQQGGKIWNRWRETAGELEPDLSGANLKNADLRNFDLRGVNLMEANLRDAKFHWATLHQAHLRKADLKGAVFVETDLSEANLCWTDLREASFRQVNLRNADLSWANLKEASLRETNLQQANLRNTDFRCAILRETDLNHADLREAYLSSAEFIDVNLEGADLREADLRGAHLLKANLKHANLSESHIYGISAWELMMDETTNQRDLVLTDWDEPTVTIDGFNVAQFMYLFLHTPQIPSIFETITSQIVLIVGRFGAERKPVLDALRGALRERNYLPVLLDIKKPEGQKFSTLLTVLGHISRCILADFTQPQTMLDAVECLAAITSAPLLPMFDAEALQEPPLLPRLRARYSHILPTFTYATPGDLSAIFEQHTSLPIHKRFQSGLSLSGD
ncbi:Gll2892 protein [Candidatus Moduliflexus flocculans]|uniref:Gll2892 protein n=1 Tax=Candidatus Moduliflexus flocculans TaxID=1499966 RepID=A0A0S6VW57_9BACT|nr:Gll2892 protein [Candidatus Moduliflexus flocculans]